MAKRRRGLGEVNADARAAIQAARAGRCSTALKHLYDTAPHIQSSSPTDKHRQDFKIASQIVNKLCVVDKPSKKRGRKYRTGGFDGARTGNMHWKSIPPGACVQDTGHSYVAVVGRKRYLVNWSSFDAAEAQRSLARRAKKSCKVRRRR